MSKSGCFSFYSVLNASAHILPAFRSFIYEERKIEEAGKSEATLARKRRFDTAGEEIAALKERKSVADGILNGKKVSTNECHPA